jgi:hypothetical protein
MPSAPRDEKAFSFPSRPNEVRVPASLKLFGTLGRKVGFLDVTRAETRFQEFNSSVLPPMATSKENPAELFDDP